jgi:predicted GIY-YIG superfamily endonuclease
MWSVYILYNPFRKTKQFYIGLTNDVLARFHKHRKGKVFFTQRDAKNWHILYVETFLSKNDAVRREQSLKNHGQAFRQLKARIRESIMELRNRCGTRISAESI